MKKSLMVFVGIILLFVLAFYVSDHYSASSSYAQVRQDRQAKLDTPQATDFTLKDLKGNPVSLKDLRGKVVYLNFWTTWCKWCKKELPAMQKIQATYSDKDLVIVAVDVGEDRDKVSRFIETNGYAFQVLLDRDKQVSQAYQVSSIPVSVFVDRDGRIAYQKLGTLKEEEMISVIDSIVK